MRRMMATAMMMAMLLAPSRALADTKEAVVWTTLLSGAGLMLVAFDYEDPCSATSVYVGGTSYCVHSSGGNYRVTSGELGGASLGRPALLYAGLASVGTGIVVMLLPKKAQKATAGLNLGVTPTGWNASKTIRFGK